MPLARFLPEKSFTASSSYNDSVKAPNVRFADGMFVSSVSKEPWCPATRDDYDYQQEFVIVDLGCPQTAHKVEGKDAYALFYSGEYSNNKKRWKILESEDETYYDKNMKVSVTSEVMLHPLPHLQVQSVNSPIAPRAPRSNQGVTPGDEVFSPRPVS